MEYHREIRIIKGRPSGQHFHHGSVAFFTQQRAEYIEEVQLLMQRSVLRKIQIPLDRKLLKWNIKFYPSRVDVMR